MFPHEKELAWAEIEPILDRVLQRVTRHPPPGWCPGGGWPQKDVNMKKYIDFKNVTKCVVMVKSEKESEAVQKALFSVGFRWPVGICAGVGYKDASCLFFDNDMEITRSLSGWDNAVNKILDGTCYPIKVSQIIEHPESLPWAKTEDTITIDGKEFSVSTVRNALREYIG